MAMARRPEVAPDALWLAAISLVIINLVADILFSVSLANLISVVLGDGEMVSEFLQAVCVSGKCDVCVCEGG
ncbi:hypothetical protein GUJ93_ZPchr0008g13348 [Zizania palustris]|uniref:Uncharacterized protein n=1 Tax=Zizania palustris TaxID=103762 RepID=A0A8J5R4I0_ZIZPA|nr:hypothetical protein GUJ93_ZPchr0008g13348 [Zizania palustris]